MISGNDPTAEYYIAVTRHPGPKLYTKAEGQEWSLCALQFPLFSLLPPALGAFPISLSLAYLLGSKPMRGC